MDWTSVRMHPRAHAAAEVVAHHIAEMTAGLNLNSSLMHDSSEDGGDCDPLAESNLKHDKDKLADR